jgi:catechol 2,3-dioxygenase-like lactoylglutathione lyase family enzyme
MTVTTYFHVGVIVPDLQKAMDDFSRVLGLTFAEPAHVHIPFLSDPDTHPHDVHVVFSEDGPPYYELIEANGSGIFSAREERKILYVGMYEPDMEGRIRILQEQGIGIEAVARFEEGAAPDWIITKPDVLGIRLEYVDSSDRPKINRWVHTGVFSTS